MCFRPRPDKCSLSALSNDTLIVSVKLAEAEARKNAEANRAKRQQILGILADKQESDLKNKTPEELQAMLAALE